MDEELEEAAHKGDVRFLKRVAKREIESGGNNYQYFLFQTRSWKGKRNILHIAIWKDRYEWVEKAVQLLPKDVIKKLLCQGDIGGDTPLHDAIALERVELLKGALRNNLFPKQVFDKVICHQKNVVAGNTPFHLAAWNGNLEIVRLLDESYGCQNGKELWSVQNDYGNTPLHDATINNKADVVDYLLRKYPGLAFFLNNNRSEGTFLHIAVAYRRLPILEAVDAFGDVAQRKRLWSMKNKEGNTPLHVATLMNWVRLVKCLVEAHPGLASIPNNSEGTFLHVAAAKGKTSIFQRLVDELGSEESKMNLLMMRNDEGNTPLHTATIRGKDEVVQFLVERCPQLALVTNNFGDTPLHLAAATSQSVSVLLDKQPYLLDAPNNSGDTPLHMAAIHGNVDVTQILLNSYCELPCHPVIKQETPLHLAIKHYESVHVDNTKAINGGDVPGIIKLLVQTKSRFACTVTDSDGFSPLHRATFLCTTYNVEVVRFILQHFPQLAEVRDRSGNTVLHLMINSIANYEQGKQLLSIAEINAMQDAINKQGKTPLDLAWEVNIIMVRVLLDVSSKQSAITAQGISALSLIRQQNELEMMEKQRKKMEEYGVIYGVRSIREKVHKFGMNFLLSQDSKKRNVLHKLLDLNSAITIRSEEYVDLVHEILVKYPVLVCEIDVNGDTPVHILVRNPLQIQFRLQHNNGYDLSSLETSDLLSKFLKLCRDYYYKVGASAEGSHYDPPWLVQNMVGNTPLHEALISNCDRKLLSRLCDDEFDIHIVAGLINKNKETPLHLLAGRSPSTEQEWNDDDVHISKLIQANREAIMLWQQESDDDDCMHTSKLIYASKEAIELRDQDGLYPLQRAIRFDNHDIIRRLYSEYPEAAEIGDVNGLTLSQMLINGEILFERHFTKKPIVLKLLSKKDKKGKTLLHRAIERQNFDLALIFIEVSRYSSFNKSLRHQPFFMRCFSPQWINIKWIEESEDKVMIIDRGEIVVINLSELCQVLKMRQDDNSSGVQGNEGNIDDDDDDENGGNAVPDVLEMLDSERNLNNDDLSGVTDVLEIQDNEGNTPLHLAIHSGHFEFVHEVLEFARKHDKVERLLEIKDKVGITPSALIGSTLDLPHKVSTNSY